MIKTVGTWDIAKACSSTRGSAARIAILVCLGLLPPDTSAAQVQDRAWRLEDLRERTAVVRSIDPADEDFSDLASLTAAIGDARIVQLGESSHSAGRTFSAKARLVKFLHRELGFDVLVWESGMYDLRTVDDSLKAGGDALRSTQLGVFPIWSGTEEVRPLLEYARASHTRDRPLEMAGMDIQFSGLDAPERFRQDLVRFSTAVESATVRDTAMRLAGRVMDDFRRFLAVDSARSEYIRGLRRSGAAAALDDSLRSWREARGRRFQPTNADLDRFLDTVDEFLELIRAQRVQFTQVHANREVAFVERILGNLRQEGIREYYRNAAARAVEGPEALAVQNRSWNLRDIRMADNLLWLARERYPARKLIIWAHNGHIMNAYYTADWSALSHSPVEGGMKPVGAYIAEEMGDSIYTIAFTAFAGEHGMAMMPQRIEPAPPGSLEALLHELGHEQAFLGFRTLPPDHWLRRPATMAIRGYQPEVMEDWTRVVDGVFFIDQMAPSTPAGWK